MKYRSETSNFCCMCKQLQVLKDAKDSITKVLVTSHQILTGSLDCFLRTYDIRMGTLDADFIGSKN